MVPDKLVERWEAAYRTYGSASKSAASSVAGDRVAARAMAVTSREVAAVWREMESVTDLPWWALAAVGAAAQAFEFQARDWTARAEHAGPPDAYAVRRPPVRLATRARPAGQRAQSQDAGQGDESW
jgi:hypothetical protein